MVVEHVLNPILFSIRISKRSLVGGEVTCILFRMRLFSSFHPNNFWNTTSWKCVLKDDCNRSSLIEFQSFLNSKIDVDPIHCVLMSIPCFMQVLCTTRYTQVDHIRILVIFVRGIHKQKEYRLSFVQTLTSRY